MRTGKARVRPIFVARVLILGAVALSAGCSAALLGSASRGNYPATADSGPTAQVSTDDTITRTIDQRLLADATLKGLRISAQTQSGVVTLKGHVPRAEQRMAAERIARSVQGVKNVRNELTVP